MSTSHTLIGLLLLLHLALAQHTHEFFWTVSHTQLNPDGAHSRQVITINNSWPAPQVRVHKHDRVIVHLTNNLTDEDTALHFHGMFQRGSSFMDGAAMVSQCPIPPGETFTYDFEVGDQVGTYWYHSHNAAQYGDGFRGVFIVEDDDTELEYDEDIAIVLSDWYHTESQNLIDKMFEPGSFGSEPRIDSSLFNESASQNIHVEPGKTYLLRVVNAGMSATQYLYIEDHTLTIVEIDGVLVDPVEVDSLNIATGQRYAVVFTAKEVMKKNYPLVQMTNIMMRKKYTIQWLVYSDELPMDTSTVKKKPVSQLHPIDDFKLVPRSGTKLLENPTRQLILDYDTDYFGEGRTLYYTVNGHPHISPLVPTINTIFSADMQSVTNPKIYGQATNAIILQKDETVELIVNSHNHMRHPFHLHGHNFQVVARGKSEHYDPKKEYMFPVTPMIRDTVNVPGNGFVILRFKADNPGVWFFHCHTEWHAVQGLGVVLIEAPDEVLAHQTLPEANKEICIKGGYKAMGNAAGNEDVEDMSGEIELMMEYKKLLEDGKKPEVKSAASTTIGASVARTTTLAKSKATKTTHSTMTSATITSTPAPKTTTTQAHMMGMDAQASLKEKSIVLALYATLMTAITGCFALCIQRSIRRKKRKTFADVAIEGLQKS